MRCIPKWAAHGLLVRLIRTLQVLAAQSRPFRDVGSHPALSFLGRQWALVLREPLAHRFLPRPVVRLRPLHEWVPRLSQPDLVDLMVATTRKTQHQWLRRCRQPRYRIEMACALGCSEFFAMRTLLCRVRFDLIETVTRILLIRGILAHYATPSTRCTVEREANRRCTSIGS